MPNTHIDGPGEQPTPARLIPGVYNYCDSWCERCRFQRSCLVHREIARHEATLTNQEVTSVESEIEEEAGDGPAVSESERQEFLSFLDEALREPTPEELAVITARIEEAHRRRRSHPLSIDAREYAEIARSVTQVLRPLLGSAGRGDDIALAAVETIDRFSLLIAVKTSRAIGGLIAADDDMADESGIDPVQSDANGCAKLLRLLIGESVEAWQVLTLVGHASADGVPAAMVRRLSALNAEIAREFPRAMAFVRPGFDER